MEADKPFDSTALADTVLRSSDNVHFYVLGAFLRYVSPTFRDMFSLNRGSAPDENEIKDGYPVISLHEDRETIHYLLSIIHPYIDEPRLDNSRLLLKVWKMAAKYGMDTVAGKLQKHALEDQWMKDEPHNMFPIAIIMSWKDGAEKAKQTLASWEEVPYSDLFGDISGTDYYGLLECRFRGASPEDGQANSDENDTSVGVGDNNTSKLFRNSCPKADIILRSSDGVDFYVSRRFLQLFSSTESFSDAKWESENGLTVVHVTDDSKALHYFLFALHQPMDKLPVENPGLIADVCMLARKYRMPIVEARLREQLAISSSLVEKPLCVYAIATSLGWRHIAKAAAKNTLSTPVEKAVTCIPELRRITGADLYHLIDYRIKCTKAACGVLDSSQLHQEFGPNHFVSQLYGMESCSDSACKSNVEKELAKCPRGSTYTNIFARTMEATNRNHKSEYWRVSAAAGFLRCFQNIAEAIEQEVDKVNLDYVNTD